MGFIHRVETFPSRLVRVRSLYPYCYCLSLGIILIGLSETGSRYFLSSSLSYWRKWICFYQLCIVLIVVSPLFDIWQSWTSWHSSLSLLCHVGFHTFYFLLLHFLRTLSQQSHGLDSNLHLHFFPPPPCTITYLIHPPLNLSNLVSYFLHVSLRLRCCARALLQFSRFRIFHALLHLFLHPF